MSETSSTRMIVLGAAAVAAGASFLDAAALPLYVRPVASAKILSGGVAALGRKTKVGIHAFHRCDAKLLCRGGCAWRWHTACSRRCILSLFMLHRAMAEQTAIPDPRTARICALHHGIAFDHIRTHAIIHNRVHPFVQSERSVPVLARENPLQKDRASRLWAFTFHMCMSMDTCSHLPVVWYRWSCLLLSHTRIRKGFQRQKGVVHVYAYGVCFEARCVQCTT